jgi:hypothetical protein
MLCSETSAHNIHTPGNHPKERIQDFISPLDKYGFHCTCFQEVWVGQFDYHCAVKQGVIEPIFETPTLGQ